MRLVLSCSSMKRFVDGVTVPPCPARRALIRGTQPGTTAERQL